MGEDHDRQDGPRDADRRDEQRDPDWRAETGDTDRWAASGDGPHATLAGRGLSDGRVGRRRVLRSLAAGGYALGLAGAVGLAPPGSTPGGTASATVALVRRDPEDPGSLEPRERTVPADWHAAVTRAFDVHDRLATTAVPGFLGSAVVPGPLADGSASISIRVERDDLSRAVERVRSLLGEVVADPDRLLDAAEDVGVAVEGVADRRPVDPDSLPGVQAFAEDGTDVTVPNLLDDRGGPRSAIPGGVYCETDESMATLAPALYGADGRARFATAGHAFRSGEDATGESLYAPREDGDRLELGAVARVHRDVDVAVVDADRPVHPSSRIQSENGDRVVGQYTRLGLADLAARGVDLEKVGARTRRTVGTVEGVDAITCFTGPPCQRGQVVWGEEGDMTDGDSGAVSYHPNPDPTDDGVLVASFTSARTWWPGQDFVWGTGAYELTDRYGLHF